MADYVYMTNPAKIGKFLKVIQKTGVPPKITTKYLEALGFKSTNDRPLVRIMKALGLASSAAEPTESWKRYRNKIEAPIVLAQGIRKHYADLFKMYPDANQKDNEALHNFFSTHTTVGTTTISFMIATFKALVGLADFQTRAPAASSTPAAITSEETGEGHDQTSKNFLQGQTKGVFAVNINIELALPENANGETFDAFFKSMKKHLLD
ncbi:MAG: DUF5343 domain-containing protein [Planctomycetota bacterium]|jgi:hypothetical protein